MDDCSLPGHNSECVITVAPPTFGWRFFVFCCFFGFLHKTRMQDSEISAPFPETYSHLFIIAQALGDFMVSSYHSYVVACWL